MPRRAIFTPLALTLAVTVAMASSAIGQESQDVPADAQSLQALEELKEPAAPDAAVQLPSLPGLFERALNNDADLARQRLELQAVEQEKPLARSQLLPQVTASGNYLYQDSTNIQTSPDEFGLEQQATRPGEIDETYWQVRLQQPLFSLERWRGLRQADAQVSAAELDLAIVERDLALKISEAYVNAFLASRKQGLLKAQQASLELQVRQAQRAYELGIGNRIDLLEAQSRLDQAIADAVQAANELDDALSELERLAGIRPEFQGHAIANLGTLEVSAPEGDPQAWIERTAANLDVLRAVAERRINQSETGIRRSGYFPELNLNLSYSDRNSDDKLRSSEDYRASVEVSVPLFRGGRTMASVRQAELRTAASQKAIDNQRNLAVQEVRRRLRSLDGNVRRLEALRQAIKSSELFLAAAERGEQLGLRDLVDVLDARASLYDQRIQFVDTLGSFTMDRLTLESAIGDLETTDLANSMSLLASISPGEQSR
ncbi:MULTISPECIES: TolC family outer membrane protein [Halomonas]|uniref:Outer membrane protein n=1 Tax=Halomonas ventosae TaxID=229007 RepID=A0A4R6HQQ1_9GAMM|nr:TolC family outer membrane protein [Halomonas ventosae]TDO10645.1 outer membrane protein [Halomonas ventosae]